MDLNIGEIVNSSGGKLICGDINLKITGISTDSRKIEKGNLFIPLKGENFDGENFVESAMNKGASAVLTANLNSLELYKGRNVAVIYVENTLVALHRLSSYYRNKFSIPFIAVTGSSGKTTTKDMIAAVLSTKYNTLKTEGNFNNEIGLPLTIFKLEKYHEVAVVEMGMSGFGEIKKLKNISKPNIAVFTNIGVAHIEKLGTRENILKAKSELLEGFDKKNTIVLNADDDMLIKLIDKYNSRYYSYGINFGNIKATEIEHTDFGIKYKLKTPEFEKSIELYIPGLHNVYNSLAAICIGIEFNVNINDMYNALKEFRPGKMRMNIIDLNGVRIIDDVYNANPDSMRAAISVLRDINSKRKIAVLGDMLELGEYAENAHRKIGEFIYKSGVDLLITSGNYSRFIADGAICSGMDIDKVFVCKDNFEANAMLKSIIEEGDLILVKGSRGMKMEQIVKFIQESVI